jgi:prepilin-type N-terminal cleavage/methylation domain-containing protein
MKHIQGFSLIELMMVVCIIGILSAIAIPQYSNYTKKAKLTEVTNMMGGARAVLVEHSMSTGDMPTSIAAGATSTARLAVTTGVNFAYSSYVYQAYWTRTNTTFGYLYVSFLKTTIDLGGPGASCYLRLEVGPKRGAWTGTCASTYIPRNN